MSTTVTNYIKNINTTFPSPGKDNPTQTFRSNSSNIVGALTSLNADVSHLTAYAADVTNTSTSFFGHTLQDVNLKNTSVTMIDNGPQSGDIIIDYSAGSYQRITVTSGPHNITITNWPKGGKASLLKLSIIAIAPNITNISFVGATPLGPSSSPYVLYATTNIFEIQSEYSALDNTGKIFTRLLNELIFDNSSLSDLIANRFITQYTGDATGNLVSRVSTVSGSNHAMLVTSNISGNPVAGLVALMPNIIKTTIVYGNWSSPTGGTADTFQVTSTKDIMVGATLYLPTTSTRLSVTIVGADTVTVSPQFPVGIGTNEVIFKNPTFRSQIPGNSPVAFPTVAYMSDTPANTTTGAVNTFTGAIYASANRLEVTFAEPNNSTVNTFAIELSNSPSVYDKTTKLANTNFVHQVLPYGAIILWSGSKASIPTGWQICDGVSPTPNLQDRFIMGAGNTYAVGATGGTADTVLLTHQHSTTEGSGHQHQITTWGTTTAGAGGPGTISGGGTNNDLHSQFTDRAFASITVGDPTGTNTAVASGAGRNIPPYYALCYIMKVSG